MDSAADHPMSYDAAEQAYAEHRFSEARDLVAIHLSKEPDDLRGLLLQGYIAFFGFQQPEVAAASYRRVLELCPEGTYRNLAEEGLQNCPVSVRAEAQQQQRRKPQSSSTITSSEPPPATPWMEQLHHKAAQTATAAEPDELPQEPQEITAMSEAEAETPPRSESSSQPTVTEEPRSEPAATYEAAEQAYQQRDFAGALRLIDAVLFENPNELRALLLQGYVHVFGLQNEAAAIRSYERVLELCADGPYRQLAEEGLTQCGINIHEPDDDNSQFTPEPEFLDADADLAFKPNPAAENEALSGRMTESTGASQRTLSEGWLLVDLSGVS
ncbi:MAG: hypothetical protein CBB79_09700 [Synechococcus sp. TMED19]|nr:MAG: hypothetical protein CBB79_09700 [Synechococcus sp. TMED19]